MLQYTSGWGCTLGSRFPLHCFLAEEGLGLPWQAVRVTGSEARVVGCAAVSPFSSVLALCGEHKRPGGKVDPRDKSPRSGWGVRGHPLLLLNAGSSPGLSPARWRVGGREAGAAHLCPGGVGPASLVKLRARALGKGKGSDLKILVVRVGRCH